MMVLGNCGGRLASAGCGVSRSASVSFGQRNLPESKLVAILSMPPVCPVGLQGKTSAVRSHPDGRQRFIGASLAGSSAVASQPRAPAHYPPSRRWTTFEASYERAGLTWPSPRRGATCRVDRPVGSVFVVVQVQWSLAAFLKGRDHCQAGAHASGPRSLFVRKKVGSCGRNAKTFARPSAAHTINTP
jgi:hypothetical protein